MSPLILLLCLSLAPPREEAAKTDGDPPVSPPLVVAVAGDRHEGLEPSPWLALFATALLEPIWAERASGIEAWRRLFDDADPDALARSLAGAVSLPAEIPGALHPHAAAGRRLVLLRLLEDRPPGGESSLQGLALLEHQGKRRTRRRVEFPLEDESKGGRVRASDGVFLPARIGQLGAGLADLLDLRLDTVDLLLAAIEADRLSGNISGAEAAARALSLRVPGHAGPLRVLGQCALAGERPARAAGHWERAVEADPENLFLHFGLAGARAAAADPVGAAAAYGEVIRLGRGRDDPLVERAREALAALEKARLAEEARRRAWERARQEVARHREAASGARPGERRLADLRARVERDPADADGWSELGETLLEERLYTAAVRALESASRADPASKRRRLALARGLLLAGRPGAVEPLLAADGSLRESAGGLVFLGDSLMARSDSGWRLDRWSEYGATLESLDPGAWLDLRPPGTADAVALWRRAGTLYERAATSAPGDPRALSRWLDWLLLEGRVDETRLGLSRATPGDGYADLHRVRAGLLLREGRRREAGASMDRFLETAARRSEDVARVVRRFLGNVTATAGAAERLLRRALEGDPGHAGLRLLRGELEALRGDHEEAAADFRYALAAGEPAFRALEDEWTRVAPGPRSERPPETPRAFSLEGMVAGAPRSLGDFTRLRMQLAGVLLEVARPAEALAELRPVEAFLLREERRLSATRVAALPGAGGDGSATEWTRLPPRLEPVNFESDRDRLRWARLRNLIARCHHLLGDLPRARQLYAWSARCLAAGRESVLPETRWETELPPRFRFVVAEALSGLARVLRDRGSPADAAAVSRWARRLRPEPDREGSDRGDR